MGLFDRELAISFNPIVADQIQLLECQKSSLEAVNMINTDDPCPNPDIHEAGLLPILNTIWNHEKEEKENIANLRAKINYLRCNLSSPFPYSRSLQDLVSFRQIPLSRV